MERKKLIKKFKKGSKTTYPEWMIPKAFYKVNVIDPILRRSYRGDGFNLIFGHKNINYGSRIVGDYTRKKLGLLERPTPDKSRDLVSQYLYEDSSLTPYPNPTPLIVNGEELTGDQFEGKIFLGDTMTLPLHMQDIVNDYITNKTLLSLTTNTPDEGGKYEHNNKGNTYDNTRAHYISLKRDENGEIYADIFDRWDMDHNKIGRTLEKIHGHPFILRQRVPVKFSDKYDYNTMGYLQNLYNPSLWEYIKTGNWNHPSAEFKRVLNEDFNLDKLSQAKQDFADYYGIEFYDKIK